MPTPNVGIVLLAGFQGGGAERVASALLAHPPRGAVTHLITNSGPDADRYPFELPEPRAAAEASRRLVLGVDMDERRLAAGGWLRNVPRMVQLLVRMRRAVRELELTSVLALLTTANLLTIVACAGLGVRVVVSERNDTSREPQPLAIRAARRLLYRFADVVTANTTIAVQDMGRYVPERRLVVVPNPIALPTAVAGPSRSTRLLTVGRLVAHKDHATAIEAFAMLGEAARDWRYVVVGEGPERDALERRADTAGVGDRVEFAGYVTAPAGHYEQAAIFVLPSRHEGLSNALLEAMAHGLACVVADSLPGALDVIDDGANGFVFRGGDVADLARVLRRLVDDPSLRRTVGRAARERVAELDPVSISDRWARLLLPDAHRPPGR